MQINKGGGAFNSLRQRTSPSPKPGNEYYNRPADTKINLKDFETFEPREDAGIEETSNASSLAVPTEAQRRFDRDVHLMLDDLDMPNQTLSSLSQSQWQGRSTRSYMSGLSHNQPGLGNHASSQASQEQLPSARQQDSNSNLTMSNSQYGTEEKHFGRHDDSPDFNRQNEVISVTDELTVSKSDLTDYPGGGKSYNDDKSEDEVQRPLLRNQNRTFADSVLDHQPHNKNNLRVGAMSDIKSGSISKTAMMLGPHRTEDSSNSRLYGLHNQAMSPYLDPRNIMIDDNALNQSDDISDLDLLTRTQISHNLQGIDPNARSKIIIPQLLDSLSQSQITSSDPSRPATKRHQNNIFKKMVDDASSLNFTPDKDSAAFSTNSLNWQFKSNNNAKETMMHAAESSESGASQLNTDRASGAQDSSPISQLKERIKQSNIQKRQGNSKVRDQELYEALETDLPLKQSSYHQRHTSVQDLRAQNQELQDQNRQLAKTCEVYQSQIVELKRQKPAQGSSNELMRVRALEAARDEIRELRAQVEEKDSRVGTLEKAIHEMEATTKQQESQIESLELQLEKQKIVIQSHKREADQKVHQANLQLEQAQKLLEKNKFQSQQASSKSESVLQKTQLQLAQTEALASQHSQEIQLLEAKLAQLSKEQAQTQTRLHTAESDAASWRARCTELTEELDRKRTNHSLKIDQSSSNFDQELRRIQEQHQKQLAKLKEENQLLRDHDSHLKQLLGTDQVHSKIEQLISSQQSLQQQLDQHKAQGPSNFTKNLLHQKDVEIQNLSDQIQTQQDATWQVEQDLKLAEAELTKLRAAKQELTQECLTLRKQLKQSEQQKAESTQFRDLERSDQLDVIKQELQAQEEQCQRQQDLITKLESQIPTLKQTFLTMVELIVDGQELTEYEADYPHMISRLQQLLSRKDLSIISHHNVLQDKSGKHDFGGFLSQLGCHKPTQTDLNYSEELEQQKQAFRELNQQYQAELQFKTDEFEIQTSQLATERQKFSQQLEQMKADYEQKLSQLRAELEQDYQSRLEQESISQTSRSQHQKSVQEEKLAQFKAEERSLKKEIGQLKRNLADQKQKMFADFAIQKQELALEHSEQLQAQLKEQRLKLLSQQESKVQSVKTEMLNKITELKNEHALKVVEFQKIQKSHDSVLQSAIEGAKREAQMQTEQTVQKQREVVERMWRKKLDEQSQKHDKVVRELQEQLEAKAEELQAQYSQELEDRLKKAQSMPLQVQQKQQATSPIKPPLSPPMLEPDEPVKESPSRQSMLSQQCNCHQEIEKQTLFIEQLKYNFEQELERQEQIHLSEQATKIVQAFVTFEQLVMLECEKILQAISNKQNQVTNRDSKRQEINGLIKQLFAQYKPQQRELKKAFENVKAKYSQVLQSLKTQVEAKYNSRQQVSSTIIIDETTATDQSDTTQQYDSRQQIVRQSTTSSAVYEQQTPTTESPRHSQTRQSLLRDYIEYQPQQENPMGRLAPHSHNSRGAVVVEVQKVVRDIQMLFDTTKMAKFCRVLLGPQSEDSAVQMSHRSSGDDQSSVVNEYRDLLNNFFKLVARLNKASDQVCQDQEVFRLRLLNVDLKQKVASLVKEQTGVVTRGLVQDVITFYQTQMSCQNPTVKRVLDSLEQLHFQISKNQFKLNQLADLFTKEGQVNQNVREVVQKCEEFSSMDQFLESSFTNKQLLPEMISPDETAQLIATVIQKLPPAARTSQSNEDILKQALQICHEQSQVLPMPPLSRLPKAHHRLATTAQQPVAGGSTMITNSTARSKSTGGGHINMPRQMLIGSGSLYQTVEPSTRYHEPSHQPKVSERYVTSQEQCSNFVVKTREPTLMSQTISNETDDYMIDEGDSAMVAMAEKQQPGPHSTLDDELASAQHNVNELFSKVQKKFSTLQY